MYHHHDQTFTLWFLGLGFAAQLVGTILALDYGSYWILAPLRWAAPFLSPLEGCWRRLNRAWIAFLGDDEPSPVGHAVLPQETASDAVPSVTPNTVGWDRYELRPDGSHVWEMGDGSRSSDNAEVAHLRERIATLVKEKQQLQAEALNGLAVARLTGRVARIEFKPEGSSATVWLAVEDGEDRHQAIKLRADLAALDVLTEGADVRVTCVWERGRLTLDAIEYVEVNNEPMPEVTLPDQMAGKVPDWFDSKAKNAPKDLLKATDGSSSVSELRVHLVWATKRRGRVLTAPMVERLKTLTAEVVKEKGLGRLLAVNAEADHVHVAIWIPANRAGSEAAGIIKAHTSRHLRKEFPELKAHHDEALWQRGCYVGAIGNGGDLSSVLAYIANQDAPQTLQEEQEAAPEDKEDQPAVSA